MIAYNALPPYPEWSDDWAEVWEEHLDRNEPYLLKWFRAPDRLPTTGANGSVGTSPIEIVRCPVFLIGGWRDGYPNPPLRLYSRAALSEEGADRAVESPAARRRRPRPAHRSPARGRALARPLVRRRAERRHGRAAGRRVHAARREARRRSARLRRHLARRVGMAGARCVASACCTLPRTAALGDEPGGDGCRRAALRPHRRRDGGALVGRNPLRPARRPAAGRGASRSLHVAAARGGRARDRTTARRAARDDLGARDRLLRQPRPTSLRTGRRTSSRRACSTSRDATR